MRATPPRKRKHNFFFFIYLVLPQFSFHDLRHFHNKWLGINRSYLTSRFAPSFNFIENCKNGNRMTLFSSRNPKSLNSPLNYSNSQKIKKNIRKGEERIRNYMDRLGQESWGRDLLNEDRQGQDSSRRTTLILLNFSNFFIGKV